MPPRAAYSGDAERMRAEIASGYQRPRDLITASARGHVECVRLLLDAGAEVHVAPTGGWTAIQCATANGRVETVRVLLEAGADPSHLGQRVHEECCWRHRPRQLPIMKLLCTYSEDRRTVISGVLREYMTEDCRAWLLETHARLDEPAAPPRAAAGRARARAARRRGRPARAQRAAR